MRVAASERRVVLLSGLLAALLLVTTACTSIGWIGTTFPGFFVMANRVVPSIALPEWADGKPSRLFQHQVVAVDGRPVDAEATIYAIVAAAPVGTTFTYTVRSPEGVAQDVAVPSRAFSLLDFVLLFGAYLVNGLAFVAIGLLVLRLKPGAPASRGLFSFSMATGLFIITAADLYGPGWFFRLHVIGESLMGAGALHLALVFPTDRLQRHRGAALCAVYAPFVVLAAVYEWVLWSPSAYTSIHLVATTSHGLGAAALIGVIAWDYLASGSALVRRRVGLVAAGALAGFLVPAVLLGTSSVLGGSVPLNAAALTAFLFPLSIAYAIVQKDLFEIDVVLRRTLTYAVVVSAIAIVYLTVLYGVGAAVPGLALGSGARLVLAILNLAVLFAIAPLRDGLQAVVDRLFFRRGYDPDEITGALSDRLARARTLPEVVATTLHVLRGALFPRRAAILLRRADGTFASAAGSDFEAAGIVVPPALEERCARGEILARYEWEDGAEQMPPLWTRLGTELLVPLRHDDGSMALLALDGTQSGRAYNTLDVAMLRTAAGQIGLALATAAAFGQLEGLNARLEEQVRERTAELEGANGELEASLGELRRAYAQLEQSQASLIRADRLATLGRLAAGIAHEMNTPLGAVMNALQSLTELGREYRDSIDDPEVVQADHREIAGEIVSAAEDAATWARKAASFIRRMKLHVHEVGSDVVERFPVTMVLDEVQTLLQHRLRASRCTIEVDAEPRDASVVGDPSRLGQVLVNLVVNAIDAYEEREAADGRIVVRVRPGPGDTVVVEVEDHAGGIAADCLPRIFDELFTTKEPGRGTGLGLCIARNLVERSFGGALTVASTPGVGSRFTATLASAGVADRPAADPDPRRRAVG